MKKFLILIIALLLMSCDKPIKQQSIPKYSTGDLVTLEIDSNSVYVIVDDFYHNKGYNELNDTYAVRKFRKVPLSSIVQISSNTSLIGGKSSNTTEDKILQIKSKYIKNL